MKVLVCIGNNLKYDTRVKRHIKSIVKHGHSVHVVACPVPDYSYGLDENEKMSHVFADYIPQEAPVNDEIMNFAREFELEEVFLNSFPILECYSYYNMPDLERYTDMLNKYVSGKRWEDITSRVSEKMDDVQALSYPLCFFERSVQYAKEVLKYEADVILCNDEDTLLAGVTHKKKYGSRLIYDFHDLMADISDGVFPQMYSNVLALFEKQMIQYADVVMSVSDGELFWSKRHYGFLAPAVPMLNCSEVSLDERKLPVKAIPEGKIRIYYHGMCDMSRGLSELMSAIKQFDEFVLVLRCLPSEMLETLKEKVVEEHIEEKVSFLEPVTAEYIPQVANRDGDIGFSFCNTEKCLNWQFALTNKFIEYTKAGLPIITSATEQQGKIVKENEIGWVLEENSTEGIIEVLHQVLKDKSKIPSMSQKSFGVAHEIFDWKHYDNLLNAVISDDNRLIRENEISLKRNKRELRAWETEDLENMGKIEAKTGIFDKIRFW